MKKPQEKPKSKSVLMLRESIARIKKNPFWVGWFVRWFVRWILRVLWNDD